MPRSVTILISKEVDIDNLKQFSLAYNYYVSPNNTNLLIEKEYNPENISRSYIMIDISEEYNSLAIESYLEFEGLNENKIALIRNSSFIGMQYNDLSFLYSYINNFFEYFKQYSSEILIDDDYGNLLTIEEFKAKYLSHFA